MIKKEMDLMRATAGGGSRGKGALFGMLVPKGAYCFPPRERDSVTARVITGPDRQGTAGGLITL